MGAEELISIATFNVENYLLESVQDRRVKAPASRHAVRDALFEMKADLVFLQELGSRQALVNIQTNLLAQGLHYSQAAYSGEFGHLFRSKSATHSRAKKASRFGSEATLVV